MLAGRAQFESRSNVTFSIEFLVSTMHWQQRMLVSFLKSFSILLLLYLYLFFVIVQFTQSRQFSIALCHNSRKQSTANMIPRMAQVRGGSWLYLYMPLAERSSRCRGDKGRKGMSIVRSDPCHSLVLLGEWVSIMAWFKSLLPLICFIKHMLR